MKRNKKILFDMYDDEEVEVSNSDNDDKNEKFCKQCGRLHGRHNFNCYFNSDLYDEEAELTIKNNDPEENE